MIRPDLPGHGADTTPPVGITMSSYTDHIGNILAALERPAVLVGHSFGGAVISQVAEHHPETVELAVYVAAFLLRDGQSVWRHGFVSPGGGVQSVLTPENLVVDETAGTLDVRREAVGDGFYPDCSTADRERAASRWRPEPVAPLRTTLALSDHNFGRTTKAYVFCESDRVVPLESQQRMCRLTSCGRTFTLASGHSPFLAVPEQLAGCLGELGDEP